MELIFSSLPNLIIDSGFHLSLHSNRQYQIVYAKFNLEIIYPPLYLREVWHYKDANDLNISARELNDDLKKIKWKISLNADSEKQAQVVIFSGKIEKLPHPSLL